MIPQRGGLPHSDIHGSKPARGSPWLFAACHVLHRLLVPRHPPNALLLLSQSTRQSSVVTPNQTSDTKRQTPNQPATQTTAASSSLTQHTHNAPEPYRRANGTNRNRCHHPSPSHPVRHHRQQQQRTQLKPDPAAPSSRQTPSGHPSCPTRPGAHQNQIHQNKDQMQTPATTRQTPDLGLTSDAASLASDPWAREDSNLRPHAYQACALTN